MWQERRKIKKGSQKILKRLTAVCLHLNVYAVPKRKMRDKLVEEGRVKEIVLEEDHDEQVVTGKIVKLFPKLLSQENSAQFHYMYATSSGDIRAELPEGHTGWDGEAVCCIADTIMCTSNQPSHTPQYRWWILHQHQSTLNRTLHQCQYQGLPFAGSVSITLLENIFCSLSVHLANFFYPRMSTLCYDRTGKSTPGKAN